MSMEGQGETQPAEGVVSVDDVADALLEGEETAPDESDEVEEESEESEGEEVEEEEAEEEGEEEEGEEASFTIKHDGKDVTLKQSELMEMAQKGFDYSQKTMVLADDRKAVQTERQELSHLRQQSEQTYQRQLQDLEALEAWAMEEVGLPPDIALAQEDAYSYLAQKELHDSRVGKLGQIRQARQRVFQEAQRQRQAWIEVQADETYRALTSTITGWNDEKLNEYAQYADGFGLTPQSAEAAFVNKGFWELIHKAKAFDELQAKKADIKPKVKAAAKVAKPSANNQSGRAAIRAKRSAEFDANPSVDSLAKVLLTQ